MATLLTDRQVAEQILQHTTVKGTIYGAMPTIDECYRGITYLEGKRKLIVTSPVDEWWKLDSEAETRSPDNGYIARWYLMRTMSGSYYKVAYVI